MGTLDGRIAIITGAGRGIGREHSLLFAREGAKVVVNDLGGAHRRQRHRRLGRAAGRRRDHGAGGEAVASHHDVADAEQAEALVALAVDTFGGVDVLVNNAGILRDRMVFSMSEAEWDDVVRVHLRGHFLPTKFAAVHWREQAKAGERGERLDRQHQLDVGPAVEPRPDQLRRRQVGHRHVHRDLPEGARPVRGAGQRHRSRRPHPADDDGARCRGALRRARGPPAGRGLRRSTRATRRTSRRSSPTWPPPTARSGARCSSCGPTRCGCSSRGPSSTRSPPTVAGPSRVSQAAAQKWGDVTWDQSLGIS